MLRKSEPDLEVLVKRYDTTLRDILNNHAPLKQRTVTIRPSNPWYSPEIDEAKKRRKQLERKWRNSKLEIDRQLFKSQRLVITNMINQAKAEYYENQILQCKGQKEVFKVVENLLHQKGNAKLPSHTCQKELAQRFNDYFFTKISKIRQDLDVIPTSYILPNVISDNPTSLESFMPATEDGFEVRQAHPRTILAKVTPRG